MFLGRICGPVLSKAIVEELDTHNLSEQKMSSLLLAISIISLEILNFACDAILVIHWCWSNSLSASKWLGFASKVTSLYLVVSTFFWKHQHVSVIKPRKKLANNTSTCAMWLHWAPPSFCSKIYWLKKKDISRKKTRSYFVSYLLCTYRKSKYIKLQSVGYND